MSGSTTLPPALLVHTTPGRKTAICGVWITCGSAHEGPRLAGATHLVEHLTLRRCGGRDRQSLAVLLDRLGGEVDAWTSFELMGVILQTTSDALEEGLALLADAVLEPSFEPADVELERRVALAELELVRDDPAERVEEEILRAAWADHPLARPVIGTARVLRNITPDQLRGHHEQMVRSGRLLAAVVGDVDPLEVAEQLRRLPLDRFPAFPRLPALEWSGHHNSVRRSGIDQAHARIAFPAMAASDPRATVLMVLNRLLGVGASSRLFQRLREDEGLTYDIWSSPVLRRIGGLLEIGWTCAPAVFAEVWRLVDEELRGVVANVGADEVEIAKEGMRRGLAIDTEAPGARCAMDVAEVLERDRRFDFDVAASEIEQVTVEQVREVAAALLRPERMASAVCGPKGLSLRVA